MYAVGCVRLGSLAGWMQGPGYIGRRLVLALGGSRGGSWGAPEKKLLARLLGRLLGHLGISWEASGKVPGMHFRRLLRVFLGA